MARLALIRHGHTAWNRAGRIQGRTDIPLAADVVEDLSRLRLPTDWQDTVVVSSPLSRAMQTAELVTGRVPLIEEALIEMHWGDWEGRHGIELGADPGSGFRHLDQWGWDFRPPNGESPADLRARLQPWLLSLQSDTVAVCHIGIMRTLLAIAHGWDFTGPLPFEIKRNRLYILNICTPLELAEPHCLRLIPAQDNAG